MPPRKLFSSPESLARRAIERMSLGSLKGRLESASPVRTGNDMGRPRGGGSQVQYDSFSSTLTIPSLTNTNPDWDLYGATNDGITEQSDPQQPTVLYDGVYMIIVTLQLHDDFSDADTFASIATGGLPPYFGSIYFSHDITIGGARDAPAATGTVVKRMVAGSSFKCDISQSAAGDREHRFAAEVVRLS